MLDILRLVRGAVADKDIVPVLTHFLIDNGRVTGSNGRICIQARCDALADIQQVLPADAFLTALGACNGPPRIEVLDQATILVRAGRTRVRLQGLPPDTFPEPLNRDGLQPVATDPEALLGALATVRPFVGTDALRLWSHGVLLRAGHAYATNNIVAVRLPVPWTGPDVIIPSEAIDELLHLGQPSAVQCSDTSVVITFDDVELHAQLIDGAWPSIDPMLDTPAVPVPVLEGLTGVLERLYKLAGTDRAVEIGPEGVVCGPAVDDSVVLEHAVRFNVDALRAVLVIAARLDFTAYPAPCTFEGANGLRGVVVGIRA